MTELVELAASSGAQAHADWLELLALKSDDGNSSFEDLVSAIRRSGSYDALDEVETFDKGSEDTQSLADDAMMELSQRAASCNGAYPFDIHNQYIQLRGKDWKTSPYVFMLLLKAFGVKAGPKEIKSATHFEEISTEAARRYIGGDSAKAESFHFGFPRRISRDGFADALSNLCTKLGEGGGPNMRRPVRLNQQKDGKLDLVVWRNFADRRRGKLVAFGQCAAGDNYDAKVYELSPRAFTGLWMLENVYPAPQLFFFIPACVNDDEWIEMIVHDVIVFDRCRIASLLDEQPLDADLADRTSKWCTAVLDEKLRTS